MTVILRLSEIPGREIDAGRFNDSKRRRHWSVLTDDRFYDEGALLLAGITSNDFPSPYVSVHPEDPRFLCKRLTGRQDRKSPLHWLVSADYDTAPWDDDEEENPLDRAAKIEWSTIKYQKAIEKDVNGHAVINSAKDYFDPPPLKDISRWTATINKNMWPLPTGILAWRDKLNAAEWVIDGLTIPRHQARVMSIHVSPIQKEGDELYRQLSYTVEFDDEDDWKGKYLNQGYYELGPVGTSPRNKTRCRVGTPAKDAVSPQLLDANGIMLTDPTPATATYQEYDVYQDMDFSVLPVA